MKEQFYYAIKAFMSLFYGGGDDAEPITDKEAKRFAIAIVLCSVAAVVIWLLVGMQP